MAEDRGIHIEDTYPEPPRAFRQVTLAVDARHTGPGVIEALWLQTGREFAGTVRVGIPKPEGFVDVVVPIDMLREALDELEAFEPEED